MLPLVACGEPSDGEWQRSASELLAAECEGGSETNVVELEGSPCGSVVFRRVGFENPDFDIVVDLEAGLIKGTGGVLADDHIDSYELQTPAQLTPDEIAIIEAGLDEIVVGRQSGDCNTDIAVDGDRHELVLGEVAFETLTCGDVLLKELETFDAVLAIFAEHADLIAPE